jgi:hypothetical protein
MQTSPQPHQGCLRRHWRQRVEEGGRRVARSMAKNSENLEKKSSLLYRRPLWAKNAVHCCLRTRFCGPSVGTQWTEELLTS